MLFALFGAKIMSEQKGEFALIDWIRSRSSFGRDVIIGIGDDTAAVRTPQSGVALLTTDTVLEGTHFNFRRCTPYQVGWKAIASAISDVAAMAGIPRYALVGLALPKDASMKFARQLYDGMRAAADICETGIIGGDVTSWRGKLAITVTVFGESPAKPITRSGARRGDAIFVTGELGGSLQRRHVEFVPRIREGLALRDAVSLHAMMDISDGLSADLRHICHASRVGAVLYEQAIPISDDAKKMSRRGSKSALQRALSDGEDFELLFTASKTAARRLETRPPFATRLSRIGEIVERGFYLQKKDGGRVSLQPNGYEHFKD